MTDDRSEDEIVTLECDYDKKCTSLYKKLEEEDYENVARFLETGFWDQALFADSNTPARQVRTWVTRFEPGDEGTVKWSQLPLHLALVLGAPYGIVLRLVNLYPEAVRCTDDERMLPLHLAFRHAAADKVVELILSQFPDAVNAKGKGGRTPIDCALRNPQTVTRGKILQLFVSNASRKVHKKRNVKPAAQADEPTKPVHSSEKTNTIVAAEPTTEETREEPISA